MKYKITFVVLLSISLSYSQSIVPKAVTQQMSAGSQPGITVFIPNVSEDNVEDAIKEITKPFKGKEIKIRRSDEFYLDNAAIDKISANTIDIHQVIAKTDNGYNYTAFFNMGGLFLDNAYSADKFQYASDIVKSIAVKASEMHMDGVLESENEVLESLEKDKERLTKGSEKLEKEIKKAKDLIKDSKDEIQHNIKVMKSKTDEIEAQRQKVIMLQNVKKMIN